MIKGKNINFLHFSLSLDDFKAFVKLHPKIFEGLYKAFNYDVWGIDATTSVPRLMTTPKDLEGELKKVSKKNPKIMKPRFFKLI